LRVSFHEIATLFFSSKIFNFQQKLQDRQKDKNCKSCKEKSKNCHANLYGSEQKKATEMTNESNQIGDLMEKNIKYLQ
jgi:hypothetical protein